MNSITIITIFGLISCLLVGLALFVVIGISTTYHSDHASRNSLILLGGLFLIAIVASVLVVSGLLGKRMPRFVELSSMLLGFGLAVFGLYLVIVDYGDWFIYIWLLTTGASLSFVVYDVSLADRGDI